ncbi:MAG: biotin--[acetyl-CoA-carboxylase] ligase [Planctomycetes bacterium]|nr:biotin--[acetyl-CoA-carboxylase] ligase [Planctomycetota bacterium]
MGQRPDQLDVDVIKAGLETETIGREILVYKQTASTNDVAWEYAGNAENGGLCVFAEEQTAGRGRRQNQWLSRAGDSVLCSVLLTDCDCGAELLTLAAGVAVCHAVDAYSCSKTRIKWPNDILINGKKVAGILLESRCDDGRNLYVIGIGINCHQGADFLSQPDLKMPATSIDMENDAPVDRNRLGRQLLVSLEHWLGVAQSSSEVVIEKWRQLSSQLGHRVTVEFNRRRFAGNCIGVDPTGGLILQLDSGGVRMFDAAHTTIVKHS